MRIDNGQQGVGASKAVPDAVVRVKVRLIAFPQRILAYQNV